jgi:hypothetical protein
MEETFFAPCTRMHDLTRAWNVDRLPGDDDFIHFLSERAARTAVAREAVTRAAQAATFLLDWATRVSCTSSRRTSSQGLVRAAAARAVRDLHEQQPLSFLSELHKRIQLKEQQRHD